MSTNAIIAHYSEETGQVVSSYCHYDGYPEGVGSVLASYYNNAHDAESAALVGYVSALKADLVQSVAESANHDAPVEYGSLDEFFSDMKQCGWIEYVYLWCEGGWKILSAIHPVFPLPANRVLQ